MEGERHDRKEITAPRTGRMVLGHLALVNVFWTQNLKN